METLNGHEWSKVFRMDQTSQLVLKMLDADGNRMISDDVTGTIALILTSEFPTSYIGKLANDGAFRLVLVPGAIR